MTTCINNLVEMKHNDMYKDAVDEHDNTKKLNGN